MDWIEVVDDVAFASQTVRLVCCVVPVAFYSCSVISTNRYLVGITDEEIASRRAAILKTDKVDFEVFAAASGTVAADGLVAVVTSRDAIKDSDVPYRVIDPYADSGSDQ